MAPTTGADYVVMQIGANDGFPLCLREKCWGKGSSQYDSTLEGDNMMFPSCFYEGSANEDG